MISSVARVINGFGAEQTAIKLLKMKYGEQIGKTSKTGKRAFKDVLLDGREVITVLNKDYFVSGKLTKKEVATRYVNFEKIIYDYDGDVLIKTSVLKDKSNSKNPVYYYHETKYSEKTPDKIIGKRQGKFNAKTGDRQEINITL